MNSNALTVGQVIRRIRAKEISPVYAVYGGEYYFEKYLIKEISSIFLNDTGVKQYFSLGLDSNEELFKELSSISLFEDKKLIIVREIKKIISQKGRKELLQYIDSPNNKIVLVMISNEYDLRNSFLKNIAEKSELVDARTPFRGKMKEWILSFVKNKAIKISNNSIDFFIDNYGDTVSSVVNEIEKASLLLADIEITEFNIAKINRVNRTYNIWEFQDSMGKKKLQQSLKIGNSLIKNGVKLPQIVVNLVYMYQQMLWKKMANYKPIGFTGIGKLITSNISRYNKIYSKDEIDVIINELSKLDILSKTTSLDEIALIETLIVRVCKK